MSQWGQNDMSVTANSTTTAETSRGAPILTQGLVKGSGRGSNPISMDSNAHFGNTSPGSRASVDATMYGNVTPGAFINNMAVGVFAINATMMQTTGGGIVLGHVSNTGSGYAANAAVTLTPVNGGSGASANTTVAGGRVTALTANQGGTGYSTAPTVAIAAPAAININANTTGVVNNALLITSANSLFLANDRLYYGVPAGNTAIGGLTGNTYYFVQAANTTGVVLAATQGGAALTLTPNASSTQVHTVTGTTATGYFDVSAVYPQVTHAGWVVRREGTGGRAGRVTYETLVAMGSIGISGTVTGGNYGTANIVAANASVDSLV